jgi:predicted nucleic acid-binding Zn ribbon protein
MTDTQPTTSGIDLARAALAAARAAAKTRPAEAPRKTRRATRTSIRRPGDPMGLGAAIGKMMTERGWEPPEAGGSILDQWPSIAPELADKVAAVRFEHDTGILHLRPATHTYATQLRLYQAQILAKVQQHPSGSTVRSLKILSAGSATPAPGRHPQRPGDPAGGGTGTDTGDGIIRVPGNPHPGPRPPACRTPGRPVRPGGHAPPRGRPSRRTPAGSRAPRRRVGGDGGPGRARPGQRGGVPGPRTRLRPPAGRQ